MAMDTYLLMIEQIMEMGPLNINGQQMELVMEEVHLIIGLIHIGIQATAELNHSVLAKEPLLEHLKNLMERYMLEEVVVDGVVLVRMEAMVLDMEGLEEVEMEHTTIHNLHKEEQELEEAVEEELGGL